MTTPKSKSAQTKLGDIEPGKVTRVDDTNSICTKHFLSKVKFETQYGCPLCESERHCAELNKIATGQTMMVTVKLDNESIPPVAFSIAASLAKIAETTDKLTTIADDVRKELASQTRKPGDDPLCPKCKEPMLVRERKDKTGKFWACSAYPVCKTTRTYEQRPERANTDSQEPLADEIPF